MHVGPKKHQVESADECQRMCKNIPICNYFTYTKEDDPSPDAWMKPKNCYMTKEANPPLKPGNWSESGPKYCPGRYWYICSINCIFSCLAYFVEKNRNLTK